MTTEHATPSRDQVPGVPDDLPDDVDELRDKIEETRAELGKTVEALAAKTDVKAQAKEKVADVKEQLKDKQEQATATVAALRDQALKAAPEPVVDALETAKVEARKRPALMAAAGLFVALIVRKMMKKNKNKEES
jgi:hypothetical protein